jgi:hypothetical protein
VAILPVVFAVHVPEDCNRTVGLRHGSTSAVSR